MDAHARVDVLHLRVVGDKRTTINVDGRCGCGSVRTAVGNRVVAHLQCTTVADREAAVHVTDGTCINGQLTTVGEIHRPWVSTGLSLDVTVVAILLRDE